jgi:hypothetical protein
VGDTHNDPTAQITINDQQSRFRGQESLDEGFGGRTPGELVSIRPPPSDRLVIICGGHRSHDPVKLGLFYGLQTTKDFFRAISQRAFHSSHRLVTGVSKQSVTLFCLGLIQGF